MNDGWISIGTLGRTHGLDGAMYADLESGNTEYRSVALRKPGGEWIESGRRFSITALAPFRKRWLVRFAGVESIEHAGTFTGCEMLVPPEERPVLEEGEYYLSDLLGCDVFDGRSGKPLGRALAWHEYGGPPLLEVGEQGLLVPFARTIFVEIDLAARRITLELPEGLDDLVAG